MGTFIFLGTIAVAILFLLGWGVLAYWKKKRVENKKRQKLLEELAPWLEGLKQMNEEQFEQEFKRIIDLWIAARETAEKLQLQFDIVCQEDWRRRKTKHQRRRKHSDLGGVGRFFGVS